MSPSTMFPVAGSSGTCPETKSRLPARTAGEYGPIAFGAFGLETAVGIGLLARRGHAAFVTRPERRHRVQTRIRLMPPLMSALTL
jgi:hypothetical protein